MNNLCHSNYAWYGDAEEAIKHGMDAMSVEFLCRKEKSQWGAVGRKYWRRNLHTSTQCSRRKEYTRYLMDLCYKDRGN
jgi:hypothetical protein